MMLRRMLAYFTIISCLAVGTVVVRTFQVTQHEISLSYTSLDFLLISPEFSAPVETLQVEEIKFASIKFDQPRKRSVKKVAKASVRPKTPVVPSMEKPQLRKHELPFGETIRVSRVYFNNELPSNLISLYTPLNISEEVMLADKNIIEDEVKVSQAKAVKEEITEEPIFFDYADEKSKEQNAPASPVSEVAEATKTELAVSNEPALLPTAKMRNEVPVAVSEVVPVGDLIAFDYSQAEPAKVAETAAPQVVSAATIQPMTTHKTAKTKTWKVTEKKKSKKVNTPVVTTQTAKAPELPQTLVDNDIPEYSSSLVGPVASSTLVKAVGTDLQGNAPLHDFEIRFMDDFSEIAEGKSAIELTQVLANEKSLRTIRLLKRGFAPTVTELVLEKAGAVTSIPMMDDETFNELLAPYEAVGPIGALLVELHDETDVAQIDVPFIKVITLDGDLRETTSDNHRYQLFVGVRAGNAFLTYKRTDGEDISKIVHIHERELSFENNLYEAGAIPKVKLFEETLLSREKAPLVISSDQVRLFASNNGSRKLNSNTYKLNLNKSANLGGRQYLELLHQNEPIFIGIRNNSDVKVPAENFMRFILSRFENSQLGNRCLIQVNLSRKARFVDVGSQSVDDTLMTSVQMLDTDGRFYDSLSEKTHKIIILGESHAPKGMSPDGKVNIKLTYEDGSMEYLNTYCSPNTYMVEQL